MASMTTPHDPTLQQVTRAYEPPAIIALGTLADLTEGNHMNTCNEDTGIYNHTSPTYKC